MMKLAIPLGFIINIFLVFPIAFITRNGKYKLSKRLLILPFIILLSNKSGLAQSDSSKNLMDSSLFSKSRNILAMEGENLLGIGFGNTVNSIASLFDPSQTFYKANQIALEFITEIDSNLFLRFGACSAITSNKSTGIRSYEFIPLRFNIGLEKHLLLTQRLAFIYGLDLYYTSSFRGAIFVIGMWRMDEYGLGISGFGGIQYRVKNNFTLRTETNIGPAMVRDFRNAGSTAVQVFKPKIIATRLLSLTLCQVF